MKKISKEELIEMYENEYNSNYKEAEYSMSYVAKDLIEFAALVVEKLNSLTP